MNVREVDVHQDYETYKELEKLCHGCDDKDVWPKRQLIKLQGKGLSLLGYYDEEKLVGADLCIVGFANNKNIFVSQSISVHPHYRGKKIAYKLRKEQLINALKIGITEIHWPFDPLRANNAWLYLSKLGVEIVDYKINYFGVTDFGLQRGLPTDRLWVKYSSEKKQYFPPKTSTVISVLEEAIPSLTEIECMGLLIPLDIDELIKSDFAKAIIARKNFREIYLQSKQRGMKFAGLQKNSKGEIIFVFERK